DIEGRLAHAGLVSRAETLDIQGPSLSLVGSLLYHWRTALRSVSPSRARARARGRSDRRSLRQATGSRPFDGALDPVRRPPQSGVRLWSARPLLDQRRVDAEIVARHARYREALLEPAADLAAIQRQHAADLADRLADALHHVAGDARIDHL